MSALPIPVRCVFMLALVLLPTACAGGATRPSPAVPTQDDFGVLVMAHGGPPEWNAAVEEALAPLRAEQPLEVAFGMADAVSLQEAVDRLEAQGVRRIGVVRLFVSGESWYERTARILGIEPGAPPRPEPAAAGDHPGHHDHHGGHRMAFWRLRTGAAYALSRDGLLDAPEMGEVLLARARALSREPSREDVLILAHGPGDDAENARWLAKLDARAGSVRAALPFRRVAVETLREDWPQARAEAERRIRAFVERAAAEGGQALVIPFRVHGFGPYADVLQGLDYRADGTGLLPHPAVTEWLRQQAAALRHATFHAPLPPVEAPPEADRNAILAMLGEYRVSFAFDETVVLQPGYARAAPKRSGAYELVVLVEDSGDRIVLQHLLVSPGGQVTKHWRQDWHWQARERLEFAADQTWLRRPLAPELTRGAWTQCVYEVSDAPRYCGTGRWRHRSGYATWTSDRTWRPLPRREYTVREDYNALDVENRHTITPDGWTHEQDNDKVRRAADGSTQGVLVREFGFNDYRRIADRDFSPARRYWQATAGYWARVRTHWDAAAAAGGLRLAMAVDGMPLIEGLFAQAARVERGETVTDAEIGALFSRYVEPLPDARLGRR